MVKRQKQQILVIHGGDAWNTYAEYLARLREWTYDPYEVRGDGWKKSLNEKLNCVYEVFLPQMPSKYNAKYIEWCIWMEKIEVFLHDEVIIIGHSLGANFVTKYFAQHRADYSIAQMHLVAGCYGLGGGFEMPVCMDILNQQCKHIWIYHSRDDQIVPYEHAMCYQRSLPHAQLVTFTDRGHFLQDDFPEIISNIVG